MKFENTKVYGFENAILGMRLPMCKDLDEAKEKSDSGFFDNNINESFLIGEKDLDLMKKLIKADDKGNGQPNSKFLREIHCQVSITAPLYWWKEADTYKVGTVSNSTSTMHKLASTPITMDCFEMDDFSEINLESGDFSFPITSTWKSIIDDLESLRKKYNETKDKRYWKELIRLLPESWLQTRMLDLNYSTLRMMCKWRSNHKLTEWSVDFINWVKTLPYAEELICLE